MPTDNDFQSLSKQLAEQRRLATETAGKISADRMALTKSLQDRQDSLANEYISKLSGQKPLQQAYNELSDSTGLNTYKQQFRLNRDLLSKLPDDVTNRTTGTLTSESQRRRQIAAEGEPIQRNLSDASSRLQDASQDVATQLQFTAKDQERELEPIKLRLELFKENSARELTGYDQTKQQELNVLLGQLETEGQLAQAEYNRMVSLAKEERDFERQKSAIKEIDLGDKVLLTDQVGNVIRVEQKGKLPGSGSGSGLDLQGFINWQQQQNKQTPPTASNEELSRLRKEAEDKFNAELGAKAKIANDQRKAVAARTYKEAEAQRRIEVAKQPIKPVSKLPAPTQYPTFKRNW